MKQVKQVHLLPTKKNSEIFLKKKELELNRNNPIYGINELGWTYQQIYFTDNSEIKEGDYYITDTKNGKKIFKCDGGKDLINYDHLITGSPIDDEDYRDSRDKNKCAKIIASTDKEITPNSWIPESFVSTFISEYNKGNVIKEVQVECEEDKFSKFKRVGYFGEWYKNNWIKTNEDKSIIISLIESRTYTREETKQLMQDSIAHCLMNPDSSLEDYYKFIEEHL